MRTGVLYRLSGHRLPALPSLRGLLQAGLGGVCVVMVAGGLFLASQPSADGVVLDRPGIPGRLASADVTATAFYEVSGDRLELTMLFSEPGDPQGVFRSRVRLMDGQRHTIVLPADTEGTVARFVFLRVGDSVEMRLDAPSPLSATLDLIG